MLTTLDVARNGMRKHGGLLGYYRGEVPLSLLAYWIASETGFDRFAVSQDPVLVEVGLSQAPLAQAFALNADPFHLETACWIAGREAVADARAWSAPTNKEGDPQPWCDWVTPPGRALWWVTQMPYSIGEGAIDHVLRCSIARALAQGRTPQNFGLLAAVTDWINVADLDAPHHKRHWGRQTGDVIKMRCEKHVKWLDQAAKLGPLDGMPGGEPAMARPGFLSPFPPALLPEAHICLSRKATAPQRAAALASVKQYAKARRDSEQAAPPPVVYSIMRALRPLAYKRRQGDTVA